MTEKGKTACSILNISLWLTCAWPCCCSLEYWWNLAAVFRYLWKVLERFDETWLKRLMSLMICWHHKTSTLFSHFGWLSRKRAVNSLYTLHVKPSPNNFSFILILLHGLSLHNLYYCFKPLESVFQMLDKTTWCHQPSKNPPADSSHRKESPSICQPICRRHNFRNSLSYIISFAAKNSCRNRSHFHTACAGGHSST